MKAFRIIFLLLTLVALYFFPSCKNDEPLTIEPAQQTDALAKRQKDTAVVSIFATGLNNPRGLKFGPDGYLYVAEGGTGGLNSSDGQCDQVIPPVGPYTGDYTARISKINSAGIRSTVIDKLPSSQTSPALGSLISGVADVEFVGHKLYALLAGAGCSHSFPSDPNGIIKVNSNGTWNLIANLSQWQRNHPVANPEPDDFEPDGTWYSMINVHGDLYAVEPNHGEVVKVTTNGHISRVIDVSATQGHIVPTAIAYHGNFFIGNLYTFPVVPGSSGIYKVTPGGHIKKEVSGLTTVLGVVFDNRDRMYVLEMSVVQNGPAPNTGKIIRIQPSGKQQDVVTGLSFPTGMTMGNDGNLYVSNKGFGFGPPIPGFGEILKIEISKKHGHHGEDDDDDDIAAKWKDEK